MVADVKAGDVLADALMDAHAETDVPGRVATEVERVRIGVLWCGPVAGVTVGRAEEHEDLVALGDDVVADADVGGGGAEERLDRGLPSDGLVEGHTSQTRRTDCG